MMRSRKLFSSLRPSDRMMPALLGYLAINAYIFFKIDISRYFDYETHEGDHDVYDVDEEFFDMILRRCTRLYRRLSKAILTL